MPRIYDFAELPRRSRRGVSAEMVPYVEAWRTGQAIGDGVTYDSDRDARRVATKFWARGKALLTEEGDPALSQRVWNEAGKFYWAIIPKQT
jgi:hypothetical protein